MKTRTLALVCLAVLGVARAQLPPRPLPALGPAPLLYARLTGPQGVRVTFYQGQTRPRQYTLPVTVGLRPGYIYRLKVEDLPSRPGLTLFPTLEVRGTLCVAPELGATRFPAPVVLEAADVERVLTGTLITRVVYVENPCKAIPESTPPDEPFVSLVGPERNVLDESRKYGRPLLVVREGDRLASEEELRACSVAGTIQFPDERILALPAGPPQLPFACFQWYDPTHGPKLATEECLADGGDCGPPAGFDREGRLVGLDPEDTVAEYRDITGRRKITCSNRVCLCVPRFAVLRQELELDQRRITVPPLVAEHIEGRVQIEGIVTPLARIQVEQVVVNIGRLKPSEVTNQEGTLPLTQFEGLITVAGVEVPFTLIATCREVHEVDLPLCLKKWCGEPKAVQIGDEVTFYLRYTNQGGQPKSDIAISDSLTGRLEYVPGSAQSDRNAVFTTQPNEAGSVILRWEIAGRLLPGESGLLSFKARIR